LLKLYLNSSKLSTSCCFFFILTSCLGKNGGYTQHVVEFSENRGTQSRLVGPKGLTSCQSASMETGLEIEDEISEVWNFLNQRFMFSQKIFFCSLYSCLFKLKIMKELVNFYLIWIMIINFFLNFCVTYMLKCCVDWVIWLGKISSPMRWRLELVRIHTQKKILRWKTTNLYGNAAHKKLSVIEKYRTFLEQKFCWACQA